VSVEKAGSAAGIRAFPAGSAVFSFFLPVIVSCQASLDGREQASLFPTKYTL